MAILTTFPAHIRAEDARDTLNAMLANIATLQGAGSGITLALSSPQSSAEGSTQTYTVTRTGNMAGDVLVDFTTAGAGSNPLNAADHNGGVFPIGRKTIAAGASTTTIVIASAQDGDVEANETGLLAITSPTANVTIANGNAIYTFTNDDTASGGVVVFPASGQSASTADTGWLDMGSTSYKVEGTIADTAWNMRLGSEIDGTPGFHIYPNGNSLRTSGARVAADGTETISNTINNIENDTTVPGVPFILTVTDNLFNLKINDKDITKFTNNQENMGLACRYVRFSTGGAARPSIIATHL